MISPRLIPFSVPTGGPITISAFLPVATPTVESLPRAFSLSRTGSSFTRGPRTGSTVSRGFRPVEFVPPPLATTGTRAAVLCLGPAAVFLVARTRTSRPRRRSAALAAPVGPGAVGFLSRPQVATRTRRPVLRRGPAAAVSVSVGRNRPALARRIGPAVAVSVPFSTLGRHPMPLGGTVLVTTVRQPVSRLGAFAAVLMLPRFGMMPRFARIVVPRLAMLRIAMVAMMISVMPGLGVLGFTVMALFATLAIMSGMMFVLPLASAVLMTAPCPFAVMILPPLSRKVVVPITPPAMAVLTRLMVATMLAARVFMAVGPRPSPVPVSVGPAAPPSFGRSDG